MCQADDSVKGEASSREGALQSDSGADADEFLKLTRAAGFGVPIRSQSEDSGEVWLTWRREQHALTVGFEGDGRYGYAMLRGGKFRAGENDGDLSALPADMIKYMMGFWGEFLLRQTEERGTSDDETARNAEPA